MDKVIQLHTKKQVISGILWKLMERGGTQGIQFVVQILLARILLPKDFGVIALITVFLTLTNVFVQSGFSAALIQKKDTNLLDFSSVFYLSLFVAGLLYASIFSLAPLISDFYGEPQLVLILRVLSVTVLFGAVNSIQNAIVARRMQFKYLTFSSLGAISLSGIVGVTMASAGFGVWALVWQQITNQFSIMIILWFTVKWRPGLLFSIYRIKGLFSFGWKVLVSALLDTTYNNLYGLIIGKIYNSTMLGFYNQGSLIPNFIVSNINSSIGSVMFPALAANQDDKLRVKTMVRRSIVTSAFIIFPIMVGLAACAESLIEIVFTDKWLPCSPLMQMMCIAYAFWPIHTANLQAINALGRSDIFLKLEFVKKSIGLIILGITIPFGIYVMVASHAVVSFIATFINSFPNRKLLNYSYVEQWRDIMPSFLLSAIMGVVIYAIQFIGWNIYLTLCIQVVVGMAIYIGLAFIYNIECFTYILGIVKELYRRNRQSGY